MNDNSGVNPAHLEVWLRNILDSPDELYTNPFLTCVDIGGGLSSVCAKQGRFFFNSFISNYANNTGIFNFHSKHACNGYEDAEICKAASIRWHPSPKMHRVMAETYAMTLLKYILDTLGKFEKSIRKMIAQTDNQPNYALACLLSFQTLQRPLHKPVKCGDICDNPMWCTTSFWPTPEHSKLHRFLDMTETHGFNVEDLVDKPVNPLIMRHGGQAPIDHKAQLVATTVGASMSVNVKVPNRFIAIVYPMGMTSQFRESLSRADLFVDGVKEECLNWVSKMLELKMENPGSWKTTVDYGKIDIPVEIENFFELTAKGPFTSVCILEASKGKHHLRIEWKEKINQDVDPAGSNTPTNFAIDMIAGL